MNEFRDLDLITATSKENIQRIMAQYHQNDNTNLLKREHDDLRDALCSQSRTDPFDSQVTLQALAQRHHNVPVMDMHDSRIDVVCHMESERRKLIDLQHEFQLQEQLQLREEIAKRKVEEELDLLEKQREIRKVASDRLLSQFHGMENLVARQEMLQYQSDTSNTIVRNDPYSMVAALGLLGQHQLDSEHVGLRKNTPQVFSDHLRMTENFIGRTNNEALSNLANLSFLHQSNGLGNFPPHLPDRNFDSTIAEIIIKNKMVPPSRRTFHQSQQNNVLNLMDEERDLVKSHSLYHSNVNEAQNQIQSNLQLENFTVAELEQTQPGNNYDNTRKKTKLVNDFSIEKTITVPNNVYSSGGGMGESVQPEMLVNKLQSNDIRYFNNGYEVNYSGAPIVTSDGSEIYDDKDSIHEKKTYHLTSLPLSSTETKDLAPVTVTTEQTKNTTGGTHMGRLTYCSAKKKVSLAGKKNHKKRKSSFLSKTKRKKDTMRNNPESFLSSADPGNIPISDTRKVSSNSNETQPNDSNETLEGPHSDLIKEVFGSKSGSDPNLSEGTKMRIGKTAEERENALTAASALLGFMKS